MVGTVLLVVSEGFDDMAFLSTQVILEESGNDVISTSNISGAIKGESSSVMTVSFSDAISQDLDYAALILIGGDKLGQIDQLPQITKDFYEKGKVIGAIGSGLKILEQTGLELDLSSGDAITLSGKCLSLENPVKCEDFAEKLATMI